MATTNLPDPPGFEELPKALQIEYLQDLWDRLSANAQEVPVRPSHIDLAESRLAEHRNNPTDVKPAQDVLDRLDRRGR